MIVPRFSKGDRVRATRDMDYKYFYSSNPGNKAQGILVAKGALGVVVDIHQRGGVYDPVICVDFSLTGKGGSWYVRVEDIAREEK